MALVDVKGLEESQKRLASAKVRARELIGACEQGVTDFGNAFTFLCGGSAVWSC